LNTVLTVSFASFNDDKHERTPAKQESNSEIKRPLGVNEWRKSYARAWCSHKNTAFLPWKG